MHRTKQEQEHLNRWISLIEKLKVNLGKDFRVIGFDPDVLCSYNGRSFTIPEEFAKKLANVGDDSIPKIFKGYKVR